MHELQAARVCGLVTSIPARIVLAGTRAQSPVHATGLHAAPARNSAPALVPGRPQRAWLAATQLRLQLRTARPGPPSAVRAPGSGQIPWAPAPPAACGPWRSWILAAGPPSAVTEVGSLRPSRWRRLATARGRFPEMPRQKWAQVAEESGSRVSALPREACHLTHSQWRTRHTGATAATPQSASRNKRASPRSY